MEQVSNKHLVVDVYGEWPSFTGARLHSVAVRMDGRTFSSIGGREVALTLHYWKDAEHHPHPDAPIPCGAEQLHRLITIVFEEPEEVRFSGFDCSNQEVGELVWRDGRFELSGTFGLSLSSSHARVLDVRLHPMSKVPDP